MPRTMRPILLLFLLSSLLLPATALATPNAPGDGTLTVKHGSGIVKLSIRGAVIGRFDDGRLVVRDPVDGDGGGVSCWGAETKHLIDTTTVCAGTDVRFRMVGGLYIVKLTANGVDLSAVGKGTAALTGVGFGPDGMYSLNGADPRSLPDEEKMLTVSAPPPPGP